MATLTVENYVKAVHKLAQQATDQRATTGRLAVEMKVSPGTVTSMLKTLSEQGLATYTPYEGVRLTESGNCLALNMLRRHRLIERFLTAVLDFDWDEVHEEAEQLEHAVSERLIERIDEYLGHPRVDPHGDPIPGPHGEMPHLESCPLTTCPLGSRFRLARVLDQSPDSLRHLKQLGFRLGVEGFVVASPPESETITVQFHGREVMLSRTVAEQILVETDRDWEPEVVCDDRMSIAAGAGFN